MRTVQLVHAALRKTQSDAVLTGQLLAINPAERAKRPRTARGEVGHQVWSAADLTTFLGAASPHQLSAFYWLAAYTGARRGALLNIRWRDVTLDVQPQIRIRGTAGVVSDGSRYEGTTKSGRERVVSIDEGRVRVLREHRERQATDQARAHGS